MPYRPLWLVLLLLASIVGSPTFAQTNPPTARQIELILQDLSVLKGRVSALQQEVSDLRTSLFWVQLQQDQYRTINLDLSSPRKYQRIDASTGSFLVSVIEGVPYLEGYKLRLNIGNPSYATYAGFTLKAKWGPKYDYSAYSVASYAKWEESLREKEFSFTDHLRPGVWNWVEVILADTKANELGFFQLSLEADTVSLLSR